MTTNYIIEATHRVFPMAGYVNLRGMVTARPIHAAMFGTHAQANSVALMLQAHMLDYTLRVVEYTS